LLNVFYQLFEDSEAMQKCMVKRYSTATQHSHCAASKYECKLNLRNIELLDHAN